MPPKDDNRLDESCELPLSISCRIGQQVNASSRPPVRKTENERQAALVAALALRSYHLPGYSWCGDWLQYMFNNHPVLGICCHHRLHPIKTCMRIIALFGSFVFGLAVTNIIFIWFVIHHQNRNAEFVSVTIGSNTTLIHGHAINNKLTVTNGMIALWTIGGTLHALFDNSVWFIAACSCCFLGPPSTKTRAVRLDYWRKYGNYLVILIVLVVTAICTLVVVLRATLQAQNVVDSQSTTSFVNNNTNNNNATTNAWIDNQGHFHFISNNVRARSFQFLIGYSVEVALALMVYYPLVGTILFTGVLGCGVLPLLGGRPREIRLERERQLRWRRSSALGRAGSPV